jgi:hypothetical protein
MPRFDQSPAVHEARKEFDRATKFQAEQRTEFLAKSLTYVERLPDSVQRVGRRLVIANERLAAATVRLNVAIAAEKSDPAALAEMSQRARVAALIASHVMGLELVENPGAADSPYRWLFVDPADGRHKHVPQFASDAGTVAKALEKLHPLDRRMFGVHLLEMVGGSPNAFGSPTIAAAMGATATAFEKARALLATFEIDENAEPPLRK